MSDTIYQKSSFDRFGDDLCEVIVGYLSLEDTFRYECVSRQFRRCVYQQQRELSLSHRLMTKIKRNLNDWNIMGQKMIELSLLKHILDKCPAINRLFVQTLESQRRDNYVNMINTIIDNVDRLTQLEIYFQVDQEVDDENNNNDNNNNDNTIANNSDQQLFDRFFAKFGPKLQKIGFNKHSSLAARHLQLCPNLQEVNLMRVENTSITDMFVSVDSLWFEKLQKIQFNYNDIREPDVMLTAFTTKYADRLTSVSIYVKGIHQNGTKLLLTALSQLRRLRSLTIKFDYNITMDYTIGNQLQQIGDNCPDLQSLEIKLSVAEIWQSWQNYEALRYYRQLRRLDIRFDYKQQLSLNIPNKLQFTSKSLDTCPLLTHLTISGRKVTDLFFNKIGETLPRLRYLNLSDTYITESSFQAISQLSRLRTLRLKVSKSYPIDAIVSLVKICPKIRLIDMFSLNFHVVIDNLMINEIKSDPNSHLLSEYLRKNSDKISYLSRVRKPI